MADQLEAVDFALAAYRDEGVWQVAEISDSALEDIHTLAAALRRLPGEEGALGMVAVDEDFFVLVRVAGPETRVLLSDVTAAEDWEIARSALDFLHFPPPSDDEEQVPAGDLNLLGDLGVPAQDLGVLIDDFDLYPEEMLSDVADRLGFGDAFDELVGITSA